MATNGIWRLPSLNGFLMASQSFSLFTRIYCAWLYFSVECICAVLNSDGSKTLFVFNSDVEQMDTLDNQNADESVATENPMAEGEDFTENSRMNFYAGVVLV